MAVLEVRDLCVRIPTEDGILDVVDKVSFSVEAGELFGIAGESGSGKSVLTQAIIGLLPQAEIGGEVLFEGVDLLRLGGKAMRRLRGARIGMIFQDPLSSLHPYYTIGSQITEAIHAHETMSRSGARERATEMLRRVGIPAAAERFDSYPHEFSGGMRQRVMIAMALVLNPPLIIADEPTTALDVTIRAQIVALLDDMRRELGTTIIMITHDLALLSSIADHVMVMYAGHRLEYGASAPLFASPAHPYTRGLLRSSPSGPKNKAGLVPIQGRPPSLLVRAPGCVFEPRCAEAMEICGREPPPMRVYDDGLQALCWLEGTPSEPIPPGAPTQMLTAGAAAEPSVVTVENVHLSFPGRLFGDKGRRDVLKGISLEIRRGETLGLVGESGCGKSTLARVIAGLIPASDGVVTLMGQPMASLHRAAWHDMRRQVQLVFQDPFGSLNPRRRVGSIIGDPFRIHGISKGAARQASVRRLMEIVGLNPEHYNRFPSEFSGGQRQRIGVARALALNPALIIFDEPVSALDVSIQAQILNLMRSLQQEFHLTYLFISHDLAVVRHVSDRIAVMNGGRIVEMADTETLYAAPQDAYTRTLLAASHPVPTAAAVPTRQLVRTLPGAMP